MKEYLEPEFTVIEIEAENCLAQSPASAKVCTFQTDDWGEAAAYRNNLWEEESR